METHDKMGKALQDQFDDFAPEPPPAVWNKVQEGLAETPPKRKLFPWVMAAVAAIALLLTVFLWVRNSKPEPVQQLAEEQPVQVEEQVLPENDSAPESPEQQPLEENAAPGTPDTAPDVKQNVKPNVVPGVVQPAPAPIAYQPEKPKNETENAPQPAPEEPKRKLFQLETLSTQSVGIAQENPEIRKADEIALPIGTENLNPENDPGYEGEAISRMEKIGQVVNAGNALFDLPANYQKQTTEAGTEEKLEANFAFFQIRRHTTYRE